MKIELDGYKATVTADVGSQDPSTNIGYTSTLDSGSDGRTELEANITEVLLEVVSGDDIITAAIDNNSLKFETKSENKDTENMRLAKYKVSFKYSGKVKIYDQAQQSTITKDFTDELVTLDKQLEVQQLQGKPDTGESAAAEEADKAAEELSSNPAPLEIDGLDIVDVKVSAITIPQKAIATLLYIDSGIIPNPVESTLALTGLGIKLLTSQLILMIQRIKCDAIAKVYLKKYNKQKSEPEKLEIPSEATDLASQVGLDLTPYIDELKKFSETLKSGSLKSLQDKLTRLVSKYYDQASSIALWTCEDQISAENMGAYFTPFSKICNLSDNCRLYQDSGGINVLAQEFQFLLVGRAYDSAIKFKEVFDQNKILKDKELIYGVEGSSPNTKPLQVKNPDSEYSIYEARTAQVLIAKIKDQTKATVDPYGSVEWAEYRCGPKCQKSIKDFAEFGTKFSTVIQNVPIQAQQLVTSVVEPMAAISVSAMGPVTTTTNPAQIIGTVTRIKSEFTDLKNSLTDVGDTLKTLPLGPFKPPLETLVNTLTSLIPG